MTTAEFKQLILNEAIYFRVKNGIEPYKIFFTKSDENILSKGTEEEFGSILMEKIIKEGLRVGLPKFFGMITSWDAKVRKIL